MFYVAAHTPAASIHDPEVFQATARRVLAGTGVEYASPYVRPAVFAPLLAWMRLLPYWAAYSVWAVLQLIAYGLTLRLLANRWHVPVRGFYPWLLFFPALFGIVTGQDSLGMALCLVAGLCLLEDERDLAGGALLSLTLYKFNLFLLIPAVLAVRGRWKALASYSAAGLCLAAASAWLEPPVTYLSLLPEIERYTIGFSPKTMLGLRGLTEALGAPHLYVPLALLVASVALWAARRGALREGFALTTLAGVLCAYHGAWYDGAVLLLPLGLALGMALPALQFLAVLAIVLPLWNVFSPWVSVLLLALFAVLCTRLLREVPAAQHLRPALGA